MDKLIVILSSTWKFAATFPVAIYGFRMSFSQTVLYTNTGGILGIIFSGLLSKGLIKLYITFWPKKLKRKPRKRFTKNNRRLVRLKTKYGLHGIVFLTPVLLSIPVGTFLVTKYYKQTILNYLYLLTSQIIWSLIYTFFYIKIKGIF
jgi:hypothetical protein